MSKTQLLDRLDDAIAQKSLLNHPFYQDWLAGKLSRESLQLYAAQYYRHVEAFPKHLRVLAARADESLKTVVLENLAEEENPVRPHPQLWRDFASALGVSEDDITTTPSLPGTQNVVHTFRDICANRSLAEAVAALYAYESQVPEIATTKIDGLNRFYGITSSKGTAYFSVHEEADKAHREAWRSWLAQNASSDGASEAQILASTNEALSALWGALDAVHSGSNAKN
ncbi:MAG TPA: CADD family putative folate metabolism protein [Candidatus Eisenbacteria bacterium]|jgi:pyrroloquinoline-quinone synthase|nr:CADD family putative folate metabolism protein [Candidatus Eisenbacteria bacterium]